MDNRLFDLFCFQVVLWNVTLIFLSKQPLVQLLNAKSQLDAQADLEVGGVNKFTLSAQKPIENPLPSALFFH
jgi:hypothetical protein